MTRTPRHRALTLLAALAGGCYTGAPASDTKDTKDTKDDATSSTGDPATASAADTDAADTADTSTSTGAALDPDPLAELDRFSKDQARAYLATIAPMVVGRLLTDGEEKLIDYYGSRGIVGIVEGWIDDPAFADTARMMMQIKLQASGQSDTIDFELPGNLAAHLAREQLPYAWLLTADFCVDGAGAEIPCDTGAPYSAGVLTTRAYLRANASRFNLRRARRMMYIFNCQVYPMPSDLQPPLEKSSLIEMFRALTPEDQTVDEAKNGFGNGFACYNCHSQFGAHAQLFVKFDQEGVYQPEATGLQDPENELGRSQNGLFVSHFVDPVAARLELSQVFGQPVAGLVDAGRVLSEHPSFYECGVRNVIEWTFGLAESEAAKTDLTLLQELAGRALARRPEPTFGDLFLVTLTHPEVIDVVLGTGANP
ncbi:MAG TPA: hypothetical protein PKW35_03955 [Nannocystaceae bacterium]|nr:hypothetical protein [Nannocystaceae bacterium]